MGEISSVASWLSTVLCGNCYSRPVCNPEISALKASIAVNDLFSVKSHIASFCRM